MKNLLIIGPFPPLYSYGGPTKSIKNIYDIFSTSNLTFSILSPNFHLNGKKIFYHNNLKNVFFKKNQLIFLITNFYKFKVIWLNSFFDKKLLLLILIRIFYSYKIIVSPRGQLSNEAIKTSNPFLKKLFINLLKVFRHFIIFHSTSDHETKCIKNFFKKINVKQISNVFNLEYIPNNIKEKKFVFYSRIHKKKGLDILLETVYKYNIDIQLDIYGFIEDYGYWKICKNYIDKLSKVNYKGILEDGDIKKISNKYSFFILPTLNENFGHVIVELLSIGCIPIISKNSNPFDKEISSIFNLNFDVDNKASLRDIINYINNIDKNVLINFKSKVKPYFLKLKEDQEKTKKMYIDFILEI